MYKITTKINEMREKNHKILKSLYVKNSIEDGIIDFYIGRNSQLDDIENYLKDKNCEILIRSKERWNMI